MVWFEHNNVMHVAWTWPSTNKPELKVPRGDLRTVLTLPSCLLKAGAGLECFGFVAGVNPHYNHSSFFSKVTSTVQQVVPNIYLFLYLQACWKMQTPQTMGSPASLSARDTLVNTPHRGMLRREAKRHVPDQVLMLCFFSFTSSCWHFRICTLRIGSSLAWVWQLCILSVKHCKTLGLVVNPLTRLMTAAKTKT